MASALVLGRMRILAIGILAIRDLGYFEALMNSLCTSMTSIHRHVWSRILLAVVCGSLSLQEERACAAESDLQLLFTSQGKSARINVDGSGQRYFNFSSPQPGHVAAGPGISGWQALDLPQHGTAPGRPRQTVR